MSAGTKIFLAVVVLFIGGLVIYYGVLSPSTATTVKRDDNVTEHAPAEIRNAPPTGNAGNQFSATDRSQPAGTRGNDALSVNSTLGRDEPRPDWTLPRFDAAGQAPLSDGGKDVPDAGFAGPPIPADYGARSIRSNVPMNIQQQRLAAATTPNGNAKALPIDSYTPYTVRPGDTLVYIAEDWFGDASKWDMIMSANPELKNPDRLRVGQTLKLPAKSAARTAQTSDRGEGGGTYTVRAGDTLSVIAWKQYGEGSAWKLIYDANASAIGSNPNRLEVGMTLTIPKRARKN